MRPNPIDTQKYRKILAREFCKYLDEIEPTDILQDFECSKEVEEKMNQLGGDIFTNLEIEKFDKDAEELIKMTIRNLKKHVNQMLPLYVLNKKGRKP